MIECFCVFGHNFSPILAQLQQKHKHSPTTRRSIYYISCIKWKTICLPKKRIFLCIPSQFQWNGYASCVPGKSLLSNHFIFHKVSICSFSLSTHRLRRKPCRNVITVPLSGIMLDYSFTLFIVWKKRIQKAKVEKKHTRCQITNKLNEKENARSLTHINKIVQIGYDICVYLMW